MQNIVTLGQINDALKITSVTAAQLAEMGFAALENKPICEALPPEESRRLRNAKLYQADSIVQIRVALAKRLAAPASCLHQIQEPPTKTEALAHYSQQAILAMGEAGAAQRVAADVPASGAVALTEYLKDCDQHSIVPDVGGAFAFAFAAGFNLATPQAAPAAVAGPHMHITQRYGAKLPDGRVRGAWTREYTVPAPATLAAPDDRAAFERELIDNHHYVPSDFSFKDGFYGGDDDYIQFGWDVWKACAALAATPAAQASVAEQALTKVLHAIQHYLPPDGVNASDTLSAIIEIVDPWPLATQPAPVTLSARAATPAAAAPMHTEMLSALQAVAMDAVGVGAGENTISDAARAKVDAVLVKLGVPWADRGAAAAAPVCDGKLPESLQRALNELRIDCKTDAVSALEFEVRSVFEGMHTSLTTVKRMYHAAQKRLELIDASQPDPLAAAAPVVLPELLSDEQIDAVFNQMPDGAQGFLKSWGYRQFARALLAGVSAPAAHEQHDAHRELYFAAYALCDGICEDHPAIDDVINAGSHGRLGNALAQLDSHYGVTSPEERTSKDHSAAIEHPIAGVHVNAVASIYVTAGGDREFDDWRVPLPVGSNLLYTAPQAQADARDADKVKPEAGHYVLAWMEGRKVPIRAMWVPQYHLSAGDEAPEGWGEYSDEKDDWYCPEGWYEANEHEETHWAVGAPVVSWMELPRLSIAAQAAQQTQGASDAV